MSNLILSIISLGTKCVISYAFERGNLMYSYHPASGITLVDSVNGISGDSICKNLRTDSIT